jgi:hypothetical protein
MGVSEILVQIDREIAQLQQARTLLSGGAAPAAPKTKSTALGAKKPAKKKRNLTPEGWKRIAEASSGVGLHRRRLHPQSSWPHNGSNNSGSFFGHFLLDRSPAKRAGITQRVSPHPYPPRFSNPVTFSTSGIKLARKCRLDIRLKGLAGSAVTEIDSGARDDV